MRANVLLVGLLMFGGSQAAPISVTPGSAAAYSYIPFSFKKGIGSRQAITLPIVSEGDSCSATPEAGDTLAVNADRSLVMVCQGGVWAPRSEGVSLLPPDGQIRSCSSQSAPCIPPACQAGYEPQWRLITGYGANSS